MIKLTKDFAIQCIQKSFQDIKSQQNYLLEDCIIDLYFIQYNIAITYKYQNDKRDNLIQQIQEKNNYIFLSINKNDDIFQKIYEIRQLIQTLKKQQQQSTLSLPIEIIDQIIDKENDIFLKKYLCQIHKRTDQFTQECQLADMLYQLKDYEEIDYYDHSELNDFNTRYVLYDIQSKDKQIIELLFNPDSHNPLRHRFICNLCKTGNIYGLIWLEENSKYRNRQYIGHDLDMASYMYVAIEYGQIQVMEWFKTHCKINERSTDVLYPRYITEAALSQKVSVMEWIKENIKHDDTCYIESQDIKNLSNISVLSWILKNCDIVEVVGRRYKIISSQYRQRLIDLLDQNIKQYEIRQQQSRKFSQNLRKRIKKRMQKRIQKRIRKIKRKFENR